MAMVGERAAFRSSHGSFFGYLSNFATGSLKFPFSLSGQALVSHHFYWNMQSDQSEGLFQGLSWNYDYMALSG